MIREIKKNVFKKNNQHLLIAAASFLILTGGVASIELTSNSNVASADSISTTSNVKATGEWGDVHAVLSDDGTLTLSGKGTLSETFPSNISKNDVTKIVFADTVKLPSVSGRLLGDFNNLKEFVGLDKVDASELTYGAGLFVEDHNVQSIDVSSWQTPKLSNAFEMFAGLHRVKNINVTGLNTSNVTDMEEMFAHNYNLTNIVGINTLDVSKVTTFKYFVGWNTSLPSLDLSNFKTNSNINLDGMFIETPSLKSINISGFNNVGSSKDMQLFSVSSSKGDDGYPDNINDEKSQLTSIITGPDMDITNAGLQNLISGINVYKMINGKAELSDSSRAQSSNWVSTVVNFVNPSHPDQAALTLLVQGILGSTVSVNVPSGYVDANNNDVITVTLGDKSADNILIYKSGVRTDSNESSGSSSASNQSDSLQNGMTNESNVSDGVIDKHKNNSAKSDIIKSKNAKANVTNEKNKVNKKQVANSSNTINRQESLPQTGEKSNFIAQILGIVMLILSFGMILRYYRNRL